MGILCLILNTEKMKILFFALFFISTTFGDAKILSKEKNGNVLSCTICEIILTAIDESIADPTNEQEIAEYLSQICNYVGQNLETWCLEFITEYTDDIIDQLVNNYLDPDKVCNAIGVCP